MTNLVTIKLGGTVRFCGKDILERLARDGRVTIDDGDAVEFYLEYEKEEHDQVVEFSPLFWLNEADVSIHTDADVKDSKTLTFYIEGPDKRSVGLNVSVAQAEALAHILSNFIAANKAVVELEKTLHVEAA